MIGDPLLLVTAGASLLAGAVLGRWLASRQQRELEIERARLETRLSEAAAKLTSLEPVRDELEQARTEVATLRTRLQDEIRLAEEKLVVYREAEEKLRGSFASLSGQALKENRDSFLALARASFGELHKESAGDLEKRQQAIDGMLEPVRKTLDAIGGRLEQVEKGRVELATGLREQLASLATAHEKLVAETSSLSRALRHPTRRGRWGEIQLRRIVEMAGLLDHCDFRTQVTSEDGRLRPDLVVHLPGRRQIVVDAKAPLDAYLAAFETDDDAQRAAHLAEHARRVRSHVQELAGKSYWRSFDPGPEFVVMFLPNEGVFSAALSTDPSLLEHGVEQRVIPASPTTLIALLRAVAYGWQQQESAANAEAIASLGRELHERLATILGHVRQLGGNLGKATESYNRLVGSLESRVLVTARRFREMGVGGRDELTSPEPREMTPRRLEAPEAEDE